MAKRTKTTPMDELARVAGLVARLGSTDPTRAHMAGVVVKAGQFLATDGHVGIIATPVSKELCEAMQDVRDGRYSGPAIKRFPLESPDDATNSPDLQRAMTELQSDTGRATQWGMNADYMAEVAGALARIVRVGRAAPRVVVRAPANTDAPLTMAAKTGDWHVVAVIMPMHTDAGDFAAFELPALTKVKGRDNE